ncbi:MAG TPA: spore germination protein [Paenibacillaceae bacterium]|nr:spore germination protein [Paenibacillaceae bacterium]
MNSLEKSIATIQQTFGQSQDLITRSFFTNYDQQVAILFLEGLADQNKIEEIVLPWFFHEGDHQQITIKNMLNGFPLSQIKIETDMNKVIKDLTSGEVCILFENEASFFIIGIQKWAARGIDEPIMDLTIKGAREGFVETISTNISLVRRFLKDPKLRVEGMSIGRMSKTNIAILYIEGIAKETIIHEVRKRLKKIDVDMILSASQIEKWIEDNDWSPFPQIRFTERPDVTASSLADGKVGVLVDNSPFALLMPLTFMESLQNIEDYYDKWYVASAIRIVRLLAFMISLFAPAFYIAFVHFLPGLIPTDLLITVISARTQVPFPAVIELLLMELTLEIFREASIRIPKPIGPSVGIIGGIVIGQSAVSAGLVSPITLIVVAITAIASFSSPSYSMAYSFRLIRFLMIFSGVYLGLYSLMLAILFFLVSLVSLESFGTPYFTPFGPMVIRDWVDSIILAPVRWRTKRPSYTTNKNKTKSRWRPLKKE